MTSLIKVAVLAAAIVLPSAAYAAGGDAEHGKAVFNQCRICHAVGPGARPGVGPVQNGVAGSVAGSRAGFNYSPAMKEAGEKGLVWNDENLGKFIENPKATVPGTRMVFPGLKNAQDRADVIAYLKTQTGQ